MEAKNTQKPHRFKKLTRLRSRGGIHLYAKKETNELLKYCYWKNGQPFLKYNCVGVASSNTKKSYSTDNEASCS